MGDTRTRGGHSRGDEDVFTADGRRLGVHVLAEGAGDRTVVLCHPAPGSGAFDPEPEQTWARGVTLLAVDRPGYGGSDPVAGDAWATVAGAADDLAGVLDSRGGGPVGVAGWSAGGRVALALAARRPDLVDRVVVIAAPAPDEAVPWLPDDYRARLAALRDQPAPAVRAALAGQLAAALPTDPLAAVALLGAGDADEGILAEPGAAGRLAGMLEVALTQGPVGLADDIAGYCLRPWGFEPAEVAAKTLLLYGAADPVAGPRHGKWYQRQLPDARYEQAPGQGHLLVIPAWKRALSHLAPGHRR
jgi:pimeloyl-ACP methyl ester carboxylesterase